MQAFINGWIDQCNRHKLPAELILVEWNPPADRPRLAEALSWPAAEGYCAVRIIEVPPEIHARYRHAQALPLYQMIGKNAGIRRARGRFILATNIDILFSDELLEFLALQQLDAGRMYRIDRHDAMAGVPESGVGDQLAYCARRLIRLNARDGTYPLSPDGRRIADGPDIASLETGIQFGGGWFPVEGAQSCRFRWAADSAEIQLSSHGALTLDLEPGPSLNGSPLALQLLDADEAQLGEITIDRRSWVTIPIVDKASSRTLILRSQNTFFPLARDPRILSFRAFCGRWETTGSGAAGLDAPKVSMHGASFALGGWLQRTWIRLQYVLELLAFSEPIAHVPVAPPRPIKRLLQFYFLRGTEAAGPVVPVMAHNPPFYLHTNACGDFTLMARERWEYLRGYPELDVYSMHLDSVLCHAAHASGARELILREPMRIFHIEHGSGWTPEGETQLFSRLREKGIPFLSHADLTGWAAQMRRLRSPIIFNGGDWGLAGITLRETRPGGEVSKRQEASEEQLYSPQLSTNAD